MLRRLAKCDGFRLKVIPARKAGILKISSSLIRRLLERGSIEQANKAMILLEELSSSKE